jgi:hypothetical protein
MVGERGENLGRRKRYVQEKTDAIMVTAVAQHFCKRNEVIVVHPDDIVGLQQIMQLVGKVRVDTPVAAEIAARKFREIEPVVQDRPKHLVGKAVVIFLVVGIDEIGHDVGHLALVNGPRGDIVLGCNGPAPAEPQAATPLEQ